MADTPGLAKEVAGYVVIDSIENDYSVPEDYAYLVTFRNTTDYPLSCSLYRFSSYTGGSWLEPAYPGGPARSVFFDLEPNGTASIPLNSGGVSGEHTFTYELYMSAAVELANGTVNWSSGSVIVDDAVFMVPSPTESLFEIVSDPVYVRSTEPPGTPLTVDTTMLLSPTLDGEFNLDAEIRFSVNLRSQAVSFTRADGQPVSLVVEENGMQYWSTRVEGVGSKEAPFELPVAITCWDASSNTIYGSVVMHGGSTIGEMVASFYYTS